MKRLRCDLIAEKLPELLSPLGVKLRKDGAKFYGPCPIHGGDNMGGVNIYLHGKYWQCHTHQCEDDWEKNVVGFIRAVLSQHKDEEVTYQQALKYVAGITNIEEYELKDNIHDIYYPDVQHNPRKYPSEVLNKLITPSTYHLNRGYSKEILEEYGVGICVNPVKPMYNRSVFPIFSSASKKFIIGCVGRSIFEECKDCNQYHAEGRCPKKHINYVKWRNSGGLPRKTLMYNRWNIQSADSMVLVEGPADVLRLVEAGITNCMAIFGTRFTSEQKNELNKLGVLNLILCFDNDEAGKTACANIVKMCKKSFNIEIPIQKDYKDIGEIPLSNTTFWKEIKNYVR